MADLSRRYRAAPGVLARELDGETVLLRLESGRYFKLNASGTLVWSWLDGTCIASALEERLRSLLGAPQSSARADLESILDELLHEGLVEALD